MANIASDSVHVDRMLNRVPTESGWPELTGSLDEFPITFRAA
jgi:hypothetical protein